MDDWTGHELAAPAQRSVLCGGDLEVVGRMPFSSNATFLVEVCGPDRRTRAVYKPGRGERPLWDFPDSLYRREVAAYELSLALGWDVVPTTVVRDGPFDEGSVQIFVEADFDEHYFTLSSDPDFRAQLVRICLFDLLANNTDRKGGHCLLGDDGHVWAIDNALCFHAEFKLRTVIWDFAGDPIPDDLLDDVRALLDRGLPPVFDELLDPFERDAIRARGDAVVHERHFPHDPSGRRYPWPIV